MHLYMYVVHVHVYIHLYIYMYITKVSMHFMVYAIVPALPALCHI